jgi:hypothetical protein
MRGVCKNIYHGICVEPKFDEDRLKGFDVLHNELKEKMDQEQKYHKAKRVYWGQSKWITAALKYFSKYDKKNLDLYLSFLCLAHKTVIPTDGDYYTPQAYDESNYSECCSNYLCKLIRAQPCYSKKLDEIEKTKNRYIKVMQRIPPSMVDMIGKMVDKVKADD